MKIMNKKQKKLLNKNEYHSRDLIINVHNKTMENIEEEEKTFFFGQFLLSKTDETNVVEICSSDHERL